MQPININQNFPLFNDSINCGEVDASVNINADVSVYAQVDLGIVAAGTLVPPSFSEFAIYSGTVPIKFTRRQFEADLCLVGVTANLEGTLNLDASAAVCRSYL